MSNLFWPLSLIFFLALSHAARTAGANDLAPLCTVYLTSATQSSRAGKYTSDTSDDRETLRDARGGSSGSSQDQDATEPQHGSIRNLYSKWQNVTPEKQC